MGHYNTKNMATEIFQILIILKDFHPKIWRRIHVKSSILLPEFHKVIQTTMGWTNSHLHQFIKGRDFYAEPSEDGFEEDFTLDSRKISLNKLMKAEQSKINYEYDFGDGWMHEIVLEKILPFDKNIQYPVCLGGEMHCPAEDVGGVHGYTNMLKILEDPKHEEYDDFLVWVGEDYDARAFDLEEVNRLLQTKDYGCFALED